MTDLRRGTTRYEFSADSRQFALLLGVAALFVVVVFFSGVLVGNLIVKRQGKAPTPAVSQDFEAALQEPPSAESEPPNLAGESAAAPTPSERPPAPPVPVQPEPTAPAVAPAASPPPPPPVARPQARVIPPARPAPVSSGAHYAVQVGAFQDRASAERMAKSLKAKGLDAFVVAAQLRGGTWYRVRVGRYSGESDAQATYRRLAAEQGIRGMIVRETE